MNSLEKIKGLYRSGNIVQAIKMATQLFQQDTRNINNALFLAYLLNQSGQPEKAIQYLKNALAASPGSEALHNNIGDLYLFSGAIPQAQQHFEAAIAINPGSIIAHTGLGNCLQQSGQADAAIASFNKVLAIDSNNTGAMLGVARCYVDGRAFDAALDIFKDMQLLEPNNPQMLNNIGALLMDIGKYPEASKIFDQLLAISPDHAIPWYNKGSVLNKMLDYQSAIKHFDKALSLAPELERIKVNRWCGMFDAGDTDQAIDEIRQQLADAPDNVEKRLLLAQFMERLVKHEEAAEILTPLLNQEQPNGRAELLYAKALRHKKDYSGAVKQLLAIDIDALEKEHQCQVHHQLGLNYDKLGDYEKAWLEIENSNQIHEKLPDFYQFDKYGMPEDLKIRQQLLKNGWSHTLPSLEDKQPRYFLVGFPRSGTTLTDRILNSHPDIHVMDERSYLYESILECQTTVKPYPLALENIPLQRLKELKTQYLDKVKADTSNAFVIDKQPLQFLDTPLILQMFPEARFIFVTRHPLDSIVSCIMQNFQANPGTAAFLSLDTTVQLFDESMKLWNRYNELLDINVHYVKYENLISDFRTQTEQLLEYTGKPWDDSVAKYHEKAQAGGRISTPSYSQVTQPLYKSAINRWANYEQVLKPYFKTLEPHIKHWGYSL